MVYCYIIKYSIIGSLQYEWVCSVSVYRISSKAYILSKYVDSEDYKSTVVEVQLHKENNDDCQTQRFQDKVNDGTSKG
jgi:hypothetical protein